MTKGSNNIAKYWIKNKFKNHSCGAFLRNIKRPHFRPTSIFQFNSAFAISQKYKTTPPAMFFVAWLKLFKSIFEVFCWYLMKNSFFLAFLYRVFKFSILQYIYFWQCCNLQFIGNILIQNNIAILFWKALVTQLLQKLEWNLNETYKTSCLWIVAKFRMHFIGSLIKLNWISAILLHESLLENFIKSWKISLVTYKNL